MSKSKYFIILIIGSVITLAKAQNTPVFQSIAAGRYADSLLATMPIEDRIGQLFMVAAYSNKGDAHKEEITKLVKDEKIGGLIFFQGGPYRQARLTNTYQALSEVPLMIGMDAEWGLGMRLDSTFNYPWAMTMGAVQDSSITYSMGVEMGKQCKRLGVHFSFSPVVDINTNPNNPIINARSFGENKDRVTQHSLALMKGLQDAGVLACAKHFPGHGDTDADSHKTLPAVTHNKGRLNDIELYPYQPLIDQGLASVMVAHLSVPALDSSGMAASLSKQIVDTLLRQQLGFSGLVFTDALNMKGVSAAYEPGEVDLMALKAGNDVMLFAEDVPKAKEKILEAIAKEELTEERLNESVKRVLMAKYFLGLKKKPIISLKNLTEDLNTVQAEVLVKRIMKEAQTLLINRDAILPIVETADKKIALVQMGKSSFSELPTYLNRYAQIEAFVLGKDQNDLLNKISAFDLVIVSYHTDNSSPWKSYKPTEAERQFLKKLALQNKFILGLLSNPYILSYLPEAEKANGLVMAYQNNKEANLAFAELVFGAIGAKGRLPVSGSSLFDVGYGQQSEVLNKLSYGLPEEVGIQREKLQGIDEIVNNAISQGATPGCQVLIAKKGKVIYQKSFGHHDYTKKKSVTENTIYDLASITKIAATLPFVMKMVEEGALDLDDELGNVYPPALGTNKEHLRIRDILAHQAGLQPWIPFYVSTLKNNQPDPEIYSEVKKEGFTKQVTTQLYMRDSYVDTMYATLLKSPLGPNNYKYSDLGYYLLKGMVEEHYNASLEKLATEQLYHPLGTNSTGFKPLDKFDKDLIPPTENDKYFRFEVIQGTVHDQGAAMLGGVGGHAGLFSNANDLAKLMQMYLNGGSYGGVEYFKPETIAEFTRCQFCEGDNRRGAGFDKPQLSGSGPTCNCVSMLSFGHTGFTGTIAWVDPEEEIVYIFLSNRTYPDAENRKLIQMNTRSEIQEVIYQSLNTYQQ